MEFIPFTAKTRMSGVNYDGHEIRKGAADAVKSYVIENGGTYSAQCEEAVKRVAQIGGTPLVVAQDYKILGVINLKDIVKDGVAEKLLTFVKWVLRLL